MRFQRFGKSPADYYGAIEIPPFGRNDSDVVENRKGKQKRRSRFCFPFLYVAPAVISTEGRNLFYLTI
ncbi:MAG: hypothetical protein LBT50_07905 [Prevotellaceae bacterium]|nr:hypothetical protein [Prevotellaceae bacterium]